MDRRISQALRERHVMNNNKSEVKLKAGDVVLIKGQEKVVAVERWSSKSGEIKG